LIRLVRVFYKCFIVTLSLRHTIFEIYDFKNAVTGTLKTGLGSVEVIENVVIRYSAYDFLLTFYGKYGLGQSRSLKD